MFDIGMAEMIVIGGAAVLLLGEQSPICTPHSYTGTDHIRVVAEFVATSNPNT